MGYRGGPSPQDVRLAEPAELETIPVEPVEHVPAPLSSLGEGLECHAILRPIPESQLPLEEKNEEVHLMEEQREHVLEQNKEPDPVEAGSCCGPVEQEQGEEQAVLLICPTAEASVCEAAHCPITRAEEQVHNDDSVITCEKEVTEVLPEQDDEGVPELEAQRVQRTPDPEHSSTPDSSVEPQSNTATAEGAVEGTTEEAQEADRGQIVSTPPSPAHATPCPQTLVPSYWSLELLIAAAFCGDCPPPSPPPTTPPQDCGGQFYPSTHGIELLSELADLELQQNRHNAGKSEGEQE